MLASLQLIPHIAAFTHLAGILNTLYHIVSRVIDPADSHQSGYFANGCSNYLGLKHIG